MIYPREFFDLQFTFAENACSLAGISLEHALFAYTNVYVRLGCGRDFDVEHARWREYLAGLRSGGDGRAWTYGHYLRDAETRTAPPLVATFGCFSYALDGSDAVRLHFADAETGDLSPLGRSRVEERRAELAALVAHVESTIGSDVVLRGISWLYNLEAYRRIFPAAYLASGRVVRGRYRSMPLWGQFVDRRGRVRDEVAGKFLRRLSACASLDGLDDCFALHPLAVEAPLHAFDRRLSSHAPQR